MLGFIEDGVYNWILNIISECKRCDDYQDDYKRMQSFFILKLKTLEKLKKLKEDLLSFECSLDLTTSTQISLTLKQCVISGERGLEKINLFKRKMKKKEADLEDRKGKYMKKKNFIKKKNEIKEKVNSLIMELTDKQKEILKKIEDPSFNFLLIGGDYGCGKTCTLKTIAENLAQKGKVAYLNLSSIESNQVSCKQLKVYSLMHQLDKDHFEGIENIDAYSAKNLIDYICHSVDCVDHENLNIYDLIEIFLDHKKNQKNLNYDV